VTERTYLDFDVLVEPASATTYRARVLNSPVGETRPVSVTIPFSELELDNFLLRIGRPRRYLVRSENAPEATAVREFGGRLFDAVFHDQLLNALTASRDQAEGRDAGLRVRLRLTDSPELADLPWEYLYDRDARRFLALSEWTPLVRYLDLPGRIRPLPVQPPLQVLVLVASPTDFPPLDVDGEWARLQEALGDLQRTGRVRLERASSGTMAELQRQLRRGRHHVFHYIGHGRYDPELGDGQLAMEGPTGRAQPISGSDLGALLHDHRTLRLGLLNSCEGARGGRTDPYSGTAQSLVYQGIPAVVAMQFEITDRAAIVFTRGFYEAVADGYPLDAAMAEARKAIRLQPNQVEWGTPVLYLRAPDGRIFDVAPRSGDAGAEPAGPVAAEVAPQAAPEPRPDGVPVPRQDPAQPPGTAQPPAAAHKQLDAPATAATPGREVGGSTAGAQQHDPGDDATAPGRGPAEQRRPSGTDGVDGATTVSPESPRPRKAAAPRARARARPATRDAATGGTPSAPRTSTRSRPADGAPASASASTPPPSSTPPPAPPSGRGPVPTPGPQPSPVYRWLVMAVVLLVVLAGGAVFVAIDRQRLSGQDDAAGAIASDSSSPGPTEPSPGPPSPSPSSSPSPSAAPSVPFPSVGAAIPVGETPGYAVATPNGEQLYVANREARTITVVDTELEQVIGRIPVPVGPPQYVAFSSDGGTAYLSLYDQDSGDGAFGVLDTRTREITKTVPMDGAPWAPAVTPGGTRVYVPDVGSNTVAVIDTGTYEVRTRIPVPPMPHSIALTADGARGYVADHVSNVLAVIDTATDTVLREVRVDAGPHSVAVHPSRPLVANVNYDGDTVTMTDTTTDGVVASIPVGDGPQDVTWSADGHFAYVTNVDADTLSVIDAHDWEVTATIPIGDAPTSVAVLPDGSRGYVTNLNEGTLRVLDLDG
jgi:YVTN family beta-propeller protein